MTAAETAHGRRGSSGSILEVVWQHHTLPRPCVEHRTDGAAERGVLFEMVASNIPVIHLLYVRGLAQQAGLPWDPIPLPQPEAYPDATSRRSVWFWPESLIYLVLLGLLIPRRR